MCNQMKFGSLAADLLSAVRQPIPDDADHALLRNFNWPDYGVTHPYVIFMTGRCGSTWLTSLIKNTGLAGNPDEFFNADVARHKIGQSDSGLANYFASVVKRESSNQRFGLEIDAVRLEETQPFIDWASVFPSRQTTTFFLCRRDLLAQAWSWVSARKSGVWHIQDSAKKNERNDRINNLPTETELASEIVRIRKTEEYLEDFFTANEYTPYHLEYESLVTELATQIALIFKQIGIGHESLSSENLASRATSSKINYSDKHKLLADFSYTHQNALTLLQRDRFNTSSTMLSGLLLNK